MWRPTLYLVFRLCNVELWGDGNMMGGSDYARREDNTAG